MRNGINHDVSRRLTVFNKSCGGTGGWALLTHFDMGNASHQCPGDYREVRQSGIRLCARDRDSIGYDGQPWKECTSAVLPTNGTSYSAVCGRVIGYGYGDISGFDTYALRIRRGLPNSIEDYFVSGVILTHGSVGSRQHIWTFATMATEDGLGCPCHFSADSTASINHPPPYVGQNYFCEGTSPRWEGYIFQNHPLWDGTGCTTSLCCDFNSPPYFNRQLPGRTRDDIELRTCNKQGPGGSYPYAGEIYIRLAEIYIK